ncbi:similar to FORKED 1 [Actinidia rufa]|uniref:Similar to FORKED 1 n=1 Tax=Actinidia rufa TaxID=165716 RepID=A0A7J0FCG9_9ERIC|nr:similar to FORKED 1 [Actinidia rufa]
MLQQQLCVKMSLLTFVPLMAELITVLISSLLAPMASATWAHWAATRAAAEATAEYLAVVDAPCFELSATTAARDAATPATDIAA